jgi:hypothetical protein
MAAFLLHEGAVVRCAHQAPASPLRSNPRVRVSGQPTIVLSTPYRVSGCPHPVNSSTKVPCVLGSWTSAASRVRSSGEPLVLTDSDSTSVNNGASFHVESSQRRVKAE